MANQEKKRGNSLADFTLGEVASGAINWLLSPGLGLVAAVQSYVVSGEFTLALVVGAFVFGMTALGINHMRQFLIASRVRGRLMMANVMVVKAADQSVTPAVDGYTIMAVLLNVSQGPIEYVMERFDVHIDGKKGAESQAINTTVVPAGMPGHHYGSHVAGLRKSEVLNAELEVEFRYGRPGRLHYRQHSKMRINFITNADGDIIGNTAFRL